MVLIEGAMKTKQKFGSLEKTSFVLITMTAIFPELQTNNRDKVCEAVETP